jgi:hypothetical protein
MFAVLPTLSVYADEFYEVSDAGGDASMNHGQTLVMDLTMYKTLVEIPHLNHGQMLIMVSTTW